MKEILLAKLSTMVTMVRAFSLGFIVFVDNTRPLLGFFHFLWKQEVVLNAIYSNLIQDKR